MLFRKKVELVKLLAGIKIVLLIQQDTYAGDQKQSQGEDNVMIPSSKLGVGLNTLNTLF